MAQPQPSHPPSPSAQKSNTLLIVAIVLILVVVVAVVAGVAFLGYFFLRPNVVNTISRQQVINIANGVITIQPGLYQAYEFNVPVAATRISIYGSFTVAGGYGGSGKPTEVLVMDQANYGSWQNNQSATKFYDSGQTTSGIIIASPATSGLYYLVYSNRFLTSTTENVQTDAFLSYFT